MSDVKERIKKRMEAVHRMKRSLILNTMIRNTFDQEAERQKELVNGIAKVNQSQVIDQAKRIESVILPAIEKKHGKNSEEYKFWGGVLDTMIWSLKLIEWSDEVYNRWCRTSMEKQYYQDYCNQLNKELMMYTTMERYMTIDMLTALKKEDRFDK